MGKNLTITYTREYLSKRPWIINCIIALWHGKHLFRVTRKDYKSYTFGESYEQMRRRFIDGKNGAWTIKKII